MVPTSIQSSATLQHHPAPYHIAHCAEYVVELHVAPHGGDVVDVQVTQRLDRSTAIRRRQWTGLHRPIHMHAAECTLDAICAGVGVRKEGISEWWRCGGSCSDSVTIMVGAVE